MGKVDFAPRGQRGPGPRRFSLPQFFAPRLLHGLVGGHRVSAQHVVFVLEHGIYAVAEYGKSDVGQGRPEYDVPGLVNERAERRRAAGVLYQNDVRREEGYAGERERVARRPVYLAGQWPLGRRVFHHYPVRLCGIQVFRANGLDIGGELGRVSAFLVAERGGAGWQGKCQQQKAGEVLHSVIPE